MSMMKNRKCIRFYRHKKRVNSLQ